jgi:hypothetical protein
MKFISFHRYGATRFFYYALTAVLSALVIPAPNPASLFTWLAVLLGAAESVYLVTKVWRRRGLRPVSRE